MTVPFVSSDVNSIAFRKTEVEFLTEFFFKAMAAFDLPVDSQHLFYSE